VLRAPVAGRVTALTARIGQPVSQQGQLMTIVPAGAKLHAELAVPSAAIGFVKQGQEVRLAIDAFPYQRFGTVMGKVQTVSASAINAQGPNETRIAVYPVTVVIDQANIAAYGRSEPLVSGMTLSARIVTEKQSLLEWLFEPLFAVRRR
jgi:membrane fusion protein